MVIHKVKAKVHKRAQHELIVWYCRNDWYMLNNTFRSCYNDIMNIKTYLYTIIMDNPLVLSHHFKLNKW